MKSSVKKRSVSIDGRKTSMTLEVLDCVEEDCS
jgi:predicted DNA-binding ribbon-helix-helix protein